MGEGSSHLRVTRSVQLEGAYMVHMRLAVIHTRNKFILQERRCPSDIEIRLDCTWLPVTRLLGVHTSPT